MYVCNGASEDTTVTKEQQLKHIKEIRKQIVKGEAFEQMAKTYSKDSVADNGGDRGTIGEESIELRRDLKMAAFQLETGQLSDVIEGPFAFYLLKVESKTIGKKKPLSNKEVRNTCEKLALLDLRKEVHDRWISRLKKNASIRRFDNQGRLITSSLPTDDLNLPGEPINAVNQSNISDLSNSLSSLGRSGSSAPSLHMPCSRSQ